MVSALPFCAEDGLFEHVIYNGTVVNDIPHVAECLQHSLLVYVPAAFLFIFAPVVLYALYKSDNGPLELCSLISLKIALGVILLLDITCLIAYELVQFAHDNGDLSYLFTYGVLYCALGTAMVLMLASRNRGLVTSGVIFNFWLFLAVCGFPEFRYKLTSYIYLPPEEEETFPYFRFYAYMVYYPVVVLELLLYCFADSPKYRLDDRKKCPELQSSFLNQLTFTWFSRISWLGYKRALDTDDLWDLNARDTSKHLTEKFQTHWDDHLTRLNLGKEKPETWFMTTKIQPKIVNGRRLYLKEDPSILIPLFKTFKWPFLAGAFYKLVFDCMTFISPQLLKLLISFVEDKSKPLWYGIMIACTMLSVSVMQSMILHQYFHNMFRLGMNIRSVLTSLVYRKALFLSNMARKKRTVGEIVNLMSVDVQKIQDMTNFIMLFWSAPFQIIMSMFFLIRLLGVAVLGGVTILVLLTPINYFISVKMQKYQVEQMKYKDARLKMTSEVLNGMKVLKLYAWEDSMKKMISDIRMKEITVLKKLAFLNAATTLSWSCAPFLFAVITFGTYVMIDPVNNVLTPQVTFVAISLFNILRFPLAIISLIMTQAIGSHVSNKRLKSFLAENELEQLQAPEGMKSDSAISIKNGFFMWDEEDQFRLRDINLNVRKGSLVAVVGRIGCGKSSLLSAMLNEMQSMSGGVAVSGSVAYVPQQPWIQNLSLKQNILFNKNYHEILYNRVLEACALNTDLSSLPAGDNTEIGEKGINLSGGQKQRVSLARSVYSQTDIYLFDDPLSAVDAHVGKHIFENVISSQTGILKYHTRILVTHGLHYLKHCDQIVVMKDGRISESGSYHDLLKSSGEFSEILEEFLVEEAKNRARSVSFGEDADDVREALAQLERLDPVKTQELQRQLSQSMERVTRSPSPTAAAPEFPSSNRKSVEEADKVPLLTNVNGMTSAKEKEATAAPPTTNEKSRLIEKEGLETGHVKMSVYMVYIRAIGCITSIVFILIYIASSALGVYSNLYLAEWSDESAEMMRRNETDASHLRLAVYTALGLGQAVSICAASILMALGMVVASRALHDNMLTNILRSPMAFFDVTPLGRILNRFGKDVEVIDNRLPSNLIGVTGVLVQASFILLVPMIVSPEIIFPLIPVFLGYYFLLDVEGVDAALPRSLMSFVRTLLSSAEIIAVIVIVTPWFAACVLILALIYFFILRFYVSTSRQLKRLESTTRSPIYSHFQESIQGAASIRAYRCVDHFLNESQTRVDKNLFIYYPSIVANRWLAVRLELIGNLIIFFAALFGAFFRDRDGVTAGLIGLSVAYAFNITQTLNWAVRMTGELETNVVAVERIKEYSELPTEADVETAPAFRLSKDWPSRGSVNFQDLEIRYRPELDLVLKGVNAHIHSEEKVGIVGRTGAGKSSLVMALFRLVEPSSGAIHIDGVNIRDIGLNDLRSRLTIVPQDPVLFSGTLRTNLDPFSRYSDDEIWGALRLTHMDTFVASLNERLEHKIAEGGENLSVGQRQLICLARALLRKSKLLVLDEAAASVDMETDQLIQKTIKEQFADCTVLTIAHRLHSVIDSNRLMVLDSGRIAEFDVPQILLHNVDSLFRSMAIDAGIITG